MSESKKTHRYKFKAEINQLLHILTHSLYKHRDIFIRELISNAADALDKIRFKEVKGEKVADPDKEREIRINLDKDNKTFTIRDTGIGMTDEELKSNIGTIAKSGTLDFLRKSAESSEDSINLIGKFGVGFYSGKVRGRVLSKYQKGRKTLAGAPKSPPICAMKRKSSRKRSGSKQS